MVQVRLRYVVVMLFGFLSIACFMPLEPVQAADQHGIEVLVATLRSAIPPAAVKEARDFDDQLMSQGQVQGGKVYLVTDERSQRVNTMVKGLLEAMGEDAQRWVVRILDTDPPTANAFVTGGKYIYVYTGLMNQATSNDELAFVLSHELGHSLLQHRIRAQQDDSSTIAGAAVLAAMLSKKYQGGFLNFANLMTRSYGRLDEEEADAIAVNIARRAGYDPLRGADFFSRMKRQQDKAETEVQADLEKEKQEVLQGQANCQQATQWYQSSIRNQTQGNTEKVNAICQEAENKRVQYNQRLTQFTQYQQQKSVGSIYSTHPADQNRIAAISALNDYIQERRELSTLQKFQQSYRVVVALHEVDSVLLKPPEKAEGEAPSALKASPKAAEAPPKTTAGPTLSEQLSELKRAKDQGLLNDVEYEEKRQQILKRF
jgi:predicted Zn-dependent protease